MSIQLRCEVDAVNLGQGGTTGVALQPGWKVTADGPGRIGDGTLAFQSTYDGADADIHNQSYITLGLFDTGANRYTTHLWAGFASAPEISQIPGSRVKTWTVTCQGLGVQGKALVSDIGGIFRVRLGADTFAQQINALCAAFATGTATHFIDGQSHVLNLTGTAILPPIDGAGLDFETILGTIFANAQKVNPALVPVWVITPDPNIGAVGGGFADPVLWVWDSAATSPAIVAAYSTSPDLTHSPILPATPYKRRTESPEIVTYRQAITTRGQVYTSQDAASSAAHPNPFDPRGVWGAPAIHDTTNSATTANATATATVSGGAVTAITVGLPGTGYTQTPSVVLTGGGGSGATALAHMAGYLLQVLVTAGGTGYTGPPRVAFSGGGGTGAQATALLIGSSVGGVTLTNAGSGYTSPPSVSFVSGSGAAAHSTVSGGHVTALVVDSGGSNYTSAPTVTLTGGGGTGAAAHAVIGGAVLQANVTTPGSGYSGTPTATFTGGGGTGAAATVQTNGDVITGLTITSGGSGYTSPPTITITGGGGTGGAATAVIGGAVVSLAVDSAGTGYTSAPTVTLTSGSGAAATATIGGQVASVTVTNGGTGYTSPPTVTFADAVQQALDAAIRPVSEPSENVKVLVDVPAPVGAWVTLTLDVIAGLVDRPYNVVSITPDYSVYGPDHPVYQLECGDLRLRPGEVPHGVGAAPVEGARLSPPQNFAATSVFHPNPGNTEVDYTWDAPPPPPGSRIDHYVLTVTINTGTYNHTVPGTATRFADYVNPGTHIIDAYITAYDQDGIPSFPSDHLTFDAAGVSVPDPPTALHVVSRGVHPGTGQGWAVIGWTRPAVLPSAYQLDWYVKGVFRGTTLVLGSATQSGTIEGLPPQAAITIQMRSLVFPNYYGPWANPPLTFQIPWFGPAPPPPDQPGDAGVVAGWTGDDESALALAPDVTYRSAASAALSPAPGNTLTLQADAVQTVTPGAWVHYGIAAALLDGSTDTAAELDLIWGDAAGTPRLTTAIPLMPLPAGVTLADDSGDVLTDDDGDVLTTLDALGVWEDQVQVPTSIDGLKTLLTAVLVTASLTAAGTVYADVYTPPRPALTAPAYTPGSVGAGAVADGAISSAKIAAGAVGDAQIGQITDATKMRLDLETNPEQLYDAAGHYRGVWTYNSGADQLRLVADNPTSATAFVLGAGRGRVIMQDTLGTLIWGSVNYKPQAVSSNTTLDSTATAIFADATGANLTLTLPAASAQPGRTYLIVKVDTSGHTVTVQAGGGDTINGAGSQVISSAYGVLRLISDGGTGWYLL